MAPGLVEPTQYNDIKPKDIKAASITDSTKYTPGRSIPESHEHYEHEDLRPRFPDVHWPRLTEVPYQDKGFEGDPHFRNLLSAATDVFDYNPKIGTEIHGIDLVNLTDTQKNDLARLIATRGVVFFRDQKNFDIEAQRELGKYFGALHRHATTSVPIRPGLEDVHVVFTGENTQDMRAMFTPTFLWHSDVRITLTSLFQSILTYIGHI
jgi:sulfonate dioxygenase